MGKIYELPAKFRDNWIAILESGKYKKNKGEYTDKDRSCYCATGLGALANGFLFTPSGAAIIVGDTDGWFFDITKSDFWHLVIKFNDIDNWSFRKTAAWLRANTIGV